MSATAAARALAETTLEDTCTITRADPTDLTAFVDGELVAGTPLAVYAGPCSISPSTTSTISDNGGTERLIETRVCRLPADAEVSTGDDLTHATGAYVIERIGHRTGAVLQRVRIVSAADAIHVPR